ncbi:Peroxisomal acyl-coenzyme A oxidase 1 [Sesamum angolense]|uniref:acyl-CoA oxidase n=1 Tax=Sesamum angolense TaxID=2727404 RepID=A0AAE1WA43_9LAMI|nr:Peroxisomal acyl-coenzyme A oxidase 1 [Sesamum angolense]
MFVPAIKGQGTDDQQQKWLPLAYKMQIIGCYAQTELGHGSNVQGLETTATFDPRTDEFVIHSPTLTSSKWWPGGLGKVSTHAVVYARLITDGKDHGVHGFIVQLRSLEDHRPLPGITIGDIGMKFGNGAYNTMDNGVLRFDHVRIPRNQMLMRVSQVTREGKYRQSDVPRQLVYGTMVYVRQQIVADASCALSRAVCIATRYSAIRRQFGSRNGGPETQVIDYKTQQSRLFPLLASAYAFRFVGEWLKWLYTDVTQRLQANDFSTLPEAHACTAGLKSLTTLPLLMELKNVESYVEAMAIFAAVGFQNYLLFVPACTYEGDNTVLLLQTELNTEPKTIIKCDYNSWLLLNVCQTRKVDPVLRGMAEDWLKPGQVLEAFEARAARMSVSCARNLSKFANPEEGLSRNFNKIFLEGVKQQLEALCGIYYLSLLHKHQGDFLATSFLTPKHAALANDQLRALYTKVRPNAIALVDSFNYTDHFLGSILGRYDGNVYPKLYEAAWRDPLNESDIPDGYHEYISPLLKKQLGSARL